IWQKLPMGRATDSIMIARYPTPESALSDEAAEAEMGPVIQAIEGLRTIRGETDLSPAVKLKAQIQTANETTRASLLKWKSYLMPLAGLSEVEISPPGPKPRQAAAQVQGELELYVPLAGLV